MQNTAKRSIRKLIKNFKALITCGLNKRKNSTQLMNEEREANLEISQNLKELHKFENSIRRKKIKPKQID